MKVGFTGTQKGMSEQQKKQLIEILTVVLEPVTEFHHGDCIGADADAHEIVLKLKMPVVVHPPINKSKRAFFSQAAKAIWPERDYLERNHEIVDECDILIAAPYGKEVLRSGTWATVRYAKKKHKDMIIFNTGMCRVIVV